MSHVIATESELTLALTEPAGRYVYRVNGTSRWAMTYGGEVSARLVAAMKKAGKLRPKYANTDDGLWLSDRTIDVDATVARRKATGNRSAIVFLGDAPNASDDLRRNPQR